MYALYVKFPFGFAVRVLMALVLVEVLGGVWLEEWVGVVLVIFLFLLL